MDNTLLPPLPWFMLLGAAALTLLLIFIVIVLFVLLRGRKNDKPTHAANDLGVDLSQLPVRGPVEGSDHLEVYGTPVRVALIVIAPAGRDSELPQGPGLGAPFEQIVPGLLELVRRDKPIIQRWPLQLSSQGFVNSFFNQVNHGGRQPSGTPWCTVAGRVQWVENAYLVGLAFCADTSNAVGNVTVEHEGQWLDILRVRRGNE